MKFHRARERQACSFQAPSPSVVPLIHPLIQYTVSQSLGIQTTTTSTSATKKTSHTESRPAGIAFQLPAEGCPRIHLHATDRRLKAAWTVGNEILQRRRCSEAEK